MVAGSGVQHPHSVRALDGHHVLLHQVDDLSGCLLDAGHRCHQQHGPMISLHGYIRLRLLGLLLLLFSFQALAILGPMAIDIAVVVAPLPPWCALGGQSAGSRAATIRVRH